MWVKNKGSDIGGVISEPLRTFMYFSNFIITDLRKTIQQKEDIMYLEFRDSFKSSERGDDWRRESFAIDELNKWIEQHQDHQVKIISYQVSYSKRHNLNQTHIFAEAIPCNSRHLKNSRLRKQKNY